MFRATLVTRLQDSEHEVVRIEEWASDHWMNCGMVVTKLNGADILNAIFEFVNRVVQR